MVNGIKVIDAHCHIYPEKIAERAVGGTDNFYKCKSFCKGTTDDLLIQGEAAGIDHFIVKNTDAWVVVWTKDNIECSISVDCQEDELDRILRSIYTKEVIS